MDQRQVNNEALTKPTTNGELSSYLRENASRLAGRVLDYWTPTSSDAEQAEDEAFRKWWEFFIKRKQGMLALHCFEAARLSMARRTASSVGDDVIMLWRLARACYFATTWKSEIDHSVQYRRRISKVKLLVPRLCYHARALALCFEGNQPGVWAALWDAAKSAGVGNKRKESRDSTKMWAGFFRALSDNLKGSLPEIDGGPFFRLYSHGNLHYQKRIDNKPPALSTMLAFELVFHLRRWSLGQTRHVWQNGQPMPKGGKPHYAVAAAFVSAALGDEQGVTGATLGNRLKRLPHDISLIRWEHLNR